MYFFSLLSAVRKGAMDNLRMNIFKRIKKKNVLQAVIWGANKLKKMCRTPEREAVITRWRPDKRLKTKKHQTTVK